MLKTGLKIDFNNDGKDETTINSQIPEINLPEYLKNTDKSVLIFDDLERCNLEIDKILGYINYFVEHQGLKAILIANEDAIPENDKYKIIKEKLIGKTFNIFLDFEGALENFIMGVKDSKVQVLLSNNSELIKKLYGRAKYENLRNLNQIVLDFERIFELLPEKVKGRSEILQEILQVLMAFSIEIKRANIRPEDISKLREEYLSELSGSVRWNQSSISNLEENSEEKSGKEKNLLQELFSRYDVDLSDPFPSAVWWQTFFDKGVIDTQELKQSLLNSKYFQDENTPSWIKLWHFSYLSDDEFNDVINEIELQYAAKEFTDIGVIKHIFGLFLIFSEAEVYSKSRSEILENSKFYIDYLKDSNQLSLLPLSTIESMFGGYKGLSFQGKEFKEFDEFSSYIVEVQELARVESMPVIGQDLLVTMKNNVQSFYRMICSASSTSEDMPALKYYKIPILKYIEPCAFVDQLLLMGFSDMRQVFFALSDRYEFDNTNKILAEERDWLKSVQNLLQKEAENRKGKVSGFSLRLLIKNYLSKAIKKLDDDGLKV
uniref:P-loop NTPase fold protein n=1 Tax=Trichocoleus desertorum TaxID=1481672 RepID=UPI0025B5AECA|nr:P-loop NTPase fold protein [Trichocoleus desertorum]